MKEFEAALETCLAALTEGRWSVEECLREYPQHADALRPHLLAASALQQAYGEATPRDEFARDARERFLIASGQRLQEAFDEEPSPSFFAAARVRLLMAAHRMRQEKAAAAAERKPFRIPVVGSPMRALAGGGMAAVLFLSAGTWTVASASSALPGDWRYPIKLQTERARLALAFGEDAERSVKLDIARERAEEIEQLAAKGRIIGPGELDRMANATASLVRDADEDWGDDDLEKLQEVTAQQKAVLNTVQTQAQVAPAAEQTLVRALTVSVEGEQRATSLIVKDEPPAVLAPGVQLIPTPNDPPTSTATATADDDPEDTVVPSATSEPSPAASPVLTLDDDPEDSEHGIAWVRVAVGRFSTLVPSQKDGWRIIGINTSDGQSTAPALVRLSNVDGTSLITLNPRNGDMYWYLLRDGFFYEVQMRIEQPSGGVLVVDRQEMTRLYGSLAEIPLYVLDHIELAPAPTATPQPTDTPEPTPTSAIAP